MISLNHFVGNSNFVFLSKTAIIISNSSGRVLRLRISHYFFTICTDNLLITLVNEWILERIKLTLPETFRWIQLPLQFSSLKYIISFKIPLHNCNEVIASNLNNLLYAYVR